MYIVCIQAYSVERECENDTKLFVCHKRSSSASVWDTFIPLFVGTMMVKPVLHVPPRGFALIKNFVHLFQVLENS